VTAHKGAKHHNAKMTTAQVRQARKSYATGKWTLQGLADKYGVTRQSMHAVIRRDTWKHIA
jgi:uncharacterized protein YjcR